MNRRNVLMLVGGGAVLAAGAGGTAWYLSAAPSTKAREAWRVAGAPEEYRQRFLSYAILAPNPHNRQPWLVRLDGEDGLTLFCDLDRRLPATDPPDRQITIGCGAFLEMLSIAASSEGYRAEVIPFPEGEPQPRLDSRPVAHVKLTPNAAQKDPAFDHILRRATNRNDNDGRLPERARLEDVAKAGTSEAVITQTTSDPEEVAALRDHVFRAFQREGATHAAHKESVELMRFGKAEVERWRDGIVLEGPMLEALSAFGVLSPEAMLDPNSTATKQGQDMYRAKANSAPAFAWMTTADNTRATQLATGRAYSRMTLKIAELGLAVHPWSHSLQEFPEMADLYKEVHGMLAPQGGTVQMLVRVGYAAPSIQAPRRGLEAHLI
jgi:hypothetical protein